MIYTAAVITISDKGYAGERVDTSGPALCEILRKSGYNVVHTALIPDEADMIKSELVECTDKKHIALILTTGGTGFSLRDVTPEATLAVIEKETPGIAEAMRVESMKITPRGCLSRGVAGIRGRSLIINLPGSKKAAEENFDAVISAVTHGLEVLTTDCSAECGNSAIPFKKNPPSMDEWMREAKADKSSKKIGMYLVHNGIVRETSKAQVRMGDASAPFVDGMIFSYDADKIEEAINETYKMKGIYYIKTWINSGKLGVGDDIMYVMVGGDIRPNVVEALQFLVNKIKTECVTETEILSSK
ncbi:MAG: MogA/MoaB family molybdenum cofactor biosynthesis protein [Clostridia bacterium]|nr:MogA/MoaB family molybdenum cofactor biosynthesis protein [Clostridia bacterium]